LREIALWGNGIPENLDKDIHGSKVILIGVIGGRRGAAKNVKARLGTSA